MSPNKKPDLRLRVIKQGAERWTDLAGGGYILARVLLGLDGMNPDDVAALMRRIELKVADGLDGWLPTWGKSRVAALGLFALAVSACAVAPAPGREIGSAAVDVSGQQSDETLALVITSITALPPTPEKAEVSPENLGYGFSIPGEILYDQRMRAILRDPADEIVRMFKAPALRLPDKDVEGAYRSLPPVETASLLAFLASHVGQGDADVMPAIRTLFSAEFPGQSADAQSGDTGEVISDTVSTGDDEWLSYGGPLLEGITLPRFQSPMEVVAFPVTDGTTAEIRSKSNISVFGSFIADGQRQFVISFETYADSALEPNLPFLSLSVVSKSTFELLTGAAMDQGSLGNGQLVLGFSDGSTVPVNEFSETVARQFMQEPFVRIEQSEEHVSIDESGSVVIPIEYARQIPTDKAPRPGDRYYVERSFAPMGEMRTVVFGGETRVTVGTDDEEEGLYYPEAVFEPETANWRKMNPDGTLGENIDLLAPKGEKTNVRLGPGTDKKVMLQLESGTTVLPSGGATDSEGASWRRIVLPDGAFGFVRGDLVQLAPDRSEELQYYQRAQRLATAWEGNRRSLDFDTFMISEGGILIPIDGEDGFTSDGAMKMAGWIATCFKSDLFRKRATETRWSFIAHRESSNPVAMSYPIFIGGPWPPAYQEWTAQQDPELSDDALKTKWQEEVYPQREWGIGFSSEWDLLETKYRKPPKVHLGSNVGYISGELGRMLAERDGEPDGFGNTEAAIPYQKELIDSVIPFLDHRNVESALSALRARIDSISQ